MGRLGNSEAPGLSLRTTEAEDSDQLVKLANLSFIELHNGTGKTPISAHSSNAAQSLNSTQKGIYEANLSRFHGKPAE